MWWIVIALVALFCYVFFLITKAAVKAAIRELEAEKAAGIERARKTSIAEKAAANQPKDE